MTVEEAMKLASETHTRERAWESELSAVDPGFRKYRQPVLRFSCATIYEKNDEYDDSEPLHRIDWR